ncbi:MAG: hypothetical protein H7A23_23175 [Leptospiraceae bacterium]|nr:hypothetical protein [Leptospiraceae bacterium]MCP5497469.1 hypothetical protein [Leptospiraceae bacterium]
MKSTVLYVLFFFAQTGGERRPIMVWPSTSTGSFFFSFFLVILIVVSIVVIMLFLSKRVQKRKSWESIYQFASTHHLNNEELLVLRVFYDSLLFPQQIDLTKNKKVFKNALIDYLQQKKGGISKEVIIFLDKLFIPSSISNRKVEEVNDLYIGEICSFEQEGEPFLCTVMEKRGDEILLSGKKITSNKIKINKPSKIYVFRPEIGGFLLEGITKEVRESSLTFKFFGETEFKGHEHLMISYKLKILLTAWPEPYYADDILNKKNTKPISESKKTTVEPFILEGTTSKVADRGVLFVVSEDASQDVITNQKLWEAELTINPNFVIRCKGKVVRSLKDNSLLFKFIDIKDNDREELYEFIKEFGGVREELI